MRIGRDVKLRSPLREQLDASGPSGADAPSVLTAVADLGLDGALFRTLYELSPTLDGALLADLAAQASDLGLYLEVGVGKVNPYMTAELPEIRDLGDGSYLAGMERMIGAAAAIGCTELWTATAFQKPQYAGVFMLDRFRTDVEWPEQLRAIGQFLGTLAPALRDHGCHLNLETHEEITSAELLRLIEQVGPDVLGVTFDSANLLAGGEHPLAAARRLAPYVRQTHLRDVALFREGGDLVRYFAPCGEGVLDWPALTKVLTEANPRLNVSIEGAGSHRGRLRVPVSDDRWRTSHADLDADEFAAVCALVDRYAQREDVPGAAVFAAGAQDVLGDIDQFVLTSAAHLRSVL